MVDERLDSAPCGYLVMGPDRAIEYANATLTEWLGYAPGSLDEAPLLEILSPISQITFEATVSPLLELRGDAMGIRAAFVALDGREVPVVYNAVRQQHGGRTVTALAAIVLGEA